jgi:hypothetical protein
LGLAFPQYAHGLPGMKHREKMPFNGFMNCVHFTLMATHCIDIDLEQDACPGVTLFAASDADTEEVWPHKWEMLYQVLPSAPINMINTFYIHIRKYKVFGLL